VCSAIWRLEQYTLKHPQEVLLVTAEVAGQAEQVAVFKGFSSSLTHPTAFDPDVPILPDDAAIISIDRLYGPFQPSNPRYIQQQMTWEAMQSLLDAAGV